VASSLAAGAMFPSHFSKVVLAGFQALMLLLKLSDSGWKKFTFGARRNLVPRGGSDRDAAPTFTEGDGTHGETVRCEHGHCSPLSLLEHAFRLRTTASTAVALFFTLWV
jgi:hypothetical protein